MLTVRDLMTASPATVSPRTQLREALAKMNAGGCRQLPVIHEGSLVGIITDRDIRLATNSPVLREEIHVTRREVLDETFVRECIIPARQTIDSFGIPLGCD